MCTIVRRIFLTNTSLPDTNVMTQLSSNVERAKALDHNNTALNATQGGRHRSAPLSFLDWIRDLWNRLGSPLSREGFALIPVKVRSFGWRRGKHGSGRR